MIKCIMIGNFLQFMLVNYYLITSESYNNWNIPILNCHENSWVQYTPEIFELNQETVQSLNNC